MKLLVTGSTGLVGSEAVDFFNEKGWEVMGIDNNMRSHFFGTANNRVPERKLDIRNEEGIEELFSQHKFDAIIHAAAQPSHDYATDHVLEDFDVNARGTLILLEATRKHCPDATFVYVSTDKVYGQQMDYHNNHSTPFNEKLGLDFAGIRSFFGCSKAAADMYVQEYGSRFGMKTVCFRPGCITGKNHQGAEQHGFLAYLVKCVKEGIRYNIYGFKGEQVRDQIHVYDLVNAFWHFIQNPPERNFPYVFNIGGGPERAISLNKAMRMIAEKTGKPSVAHYVPKSREGDRDWDVHDVSLFRSFYPEWDYKYSLQDIIDELCTA